MDIWKEVLCLGEQMDPKTGRWFKITPRRIADAHKNCRRMLSRGVPLPAVWEHQDIEAADAPPGADAIAEWKRAYARYTFAFIGNSRINDRGNLELRHDGVSERDAEQLERVRSVSPKIYNGYLDSKGGEYEGTTVAHVAATPTPVQYWQKPWQLSDSTALYLSYAPPDGAPDGAECPDYDSGVGAVADWFESLDLSATDADDPGEETTVPDDSDKKGEAPKGDGKTGDLKMVMDAIKAAFPGAKISDKVSNWSELCIALESQSGEPDADEPAEEVAPDEETAGAGGPPMVMSTLDKNPTRKRQAQAWARDERKDALARIDAAFKGDGRAARDPQTAKRLRRRVESFDSVELSFTADGEPDTPRWKALAADIAAYEASAPTVALKADGSVDLSATAAVGPPRLGAAAGLKDPTGQLGADILGGKITVAEAAAK